MRHGPSTTVPVKGATGAPRQIDLPARASGQLGGGLVVARVPHPHLETVAHAAHRRHLGAAHRQCLAGGRVADRVRRARSRRRPSRAGSGHAPDLGRVGHPQVQEGVVHQGVGIGRTDLDGVAQRVGPDHLGAFDRGGRAGGHRARRHRASGDDAGATQQGQGQGVGPGVVGQRRGRGREVGIDSEAVGGSDVHQLVLQQAVVHHGQASGPHEAPRREGGHPPLVGAALGAQPPLHHREGALGLRRRRRLGQGQPHPEAVITARVLELGGDPDQGLAGADLHGGGDDHVLAARSGGRSSTRAGQS